MVAEYKVSIKLKSEFPRGIDDEGNPHFWDMDSIGNEIYSWLEDLGFDLEIEVEEVI